MYLTASGREDGEDPYYMHNYRANLDGSGMKLLDPGDASHAVAWPPIRASYFVDNSSRVNTRAESACFTTRREPKPCRWRKWMSLRCLTAGYKFPEPFKVKADDGITDLYGVMYKPFDFDPNKKYPDHRVRLSRAADRERDPDVHAAKAPISRWPTWASS